MAQPIKHERSATIFFTTIAFFALTTLTTLAFLAMQSMPSPLSGSLPLWFLFALLSGVATIFLPSGLPFAFLAIPSPHERRTLTSLGMILLFALGTSLILLLYGSALGTLGSFVVNVFPKEVMDRIMPWVYLLGGMFTYFLALGELNLTTLRMPTYIGASPEFVQNRKGAGRSFMLGLFLGNIGVGASFPAIPLLLMGTVFSGSAAFGGLLLLVHALGRILPLLLLLALATVKYDGLGALLQHKKNFDKGSGWVFVLLTASIITFGLYGDGWSSLATLSTLVSSAFAAFFPTLEIGQTVTFALGVLGTAAQGANVVFLALLLIPLWCGYYRRRQIVYGSPLHRVREIECEISRLLDEEQGHQATTHIASPRQHERVKALLREIDMLLTKRQIHVAALRFSHEDKKDDPLHDLERGALALERNWYITLTILLLVVVLVIL